MTRFTYFLLLSLVGSACAQEDKPKNADDFWKKVDTKITQQVNKRIDDKNLVKVPTLPVDDKNPKLPAGFDDRFLNRNGTVNGIFNGNLSSPSPFPSPSSRTSAVGPQNVLSSFTFFSILCAFM